MQRFVSSCLPVVALIGGFWLTACGSGQVSAQSEEDDAVGESRRHGRRCTDKKSQYCIENPGATGEDCCAYVRELNAQDTTIQCDDKCLTRLEDECKLSAIKVCPAEDDADDDSDE